MAGLSPQVTNTLQWGCIMMLQGSVLRLSGAKTYGIVMQFAGLITVALGVLLWAGVI